MGCGVTHNGGKNDKFGGDLDYAYDDGDSDGDGDDGGDPDYAYDDGDSVL